MSHLFSILTYYESYQQISKEVSYTLSYQPTQLPVLDEDTETYPMIPLKAHRQQKVLLIFELQMPFFPILPPLQQGLVKDTGEFI
jgi:hypothetical protein